MEDLQITKAQIYISMTINKLMFRKISMKRKGLSDESIKEVDYTIHDLNSSLETFKTLEKNWRVSRDRNFDLERCYQMAIMEIKSLELKNKELIDMI